MARPVVVVVGDEDASRQALARELEGRYGTHYRIMSSASPQEALAGLQQLQVEGADVPLVLADQWMPGRTGAQFLARVRELHPTARRGLLIYWGDQPAMAAVVEAAALGQIDFYLPKPVWSPDEQFHRAITESLEQWWRQQGGQFAAVTVIGTEPSARVHEICDLLTRNSGRPGLDGMAPHPSRSLLAARLVLRAARWPHSRVASWSASTSPSTIAITMTATGQKPCSQPAVASIAIAPTIPATRDHLHQSGHCARCPAPGPIARQPGRKTDRQGGDPGLEDVHRRPP